MFGLELGSSMILVLVSFLVNKLLDLKRGMERQFKEEKSVDHELR